MNERVDMMRNTNVTEQGNPSWETYFPKTVDDAVMITNDQGNIPNAEAQTLKEKLADMSNASGLTVKDTEGMLGEALKNVNLQTLIDTIADKVLNELMAKSQIATSIENSTSTVPASSLLYQLNSDLNSRTAVSDLNTAVDVSPHAPLIVQCNENTLNTPYKAGLTSSASGTAYITGGSDSNYLTMFYVPASDPNMFIRSRANGTWYDWGHIITNADLDGHIVLLSGGATALEASGGNTRFRLQLNSNGNVTLYRSTDDGSTWPESKTVATWG